MNICCPRKHLNEFNFSSSRTATLLQQLSQRFLTYLLRVFAFTYIHTTNALMTQVRSERKKKNCKKKNGDRDHFFTYENTVFIPNELGDITMY